MEATTRMKILIASRGVVPVRAGCGGAEIVVYQLSRWLAAQGHDVTLVAEVDEDEFEILPGLEVVPVGSSASRWWRWLPDGLARWVVQHLIGNIVVALTVRRLVRDRADGFDVVHAHGALSALLISLRRPAPLVYTEHDATPWSCRYRRWYERWLRKTIYRALNVTVFKRADHVVTVFPSLAAEITRHWRIEAAKVSVIGNGADIEAFRPRDASGSRVRRELGLERYALFVGSLVPRKCPDLLVDALAEAGDIPCVFVGDGPMRPRLERRAQELGIADRVVMMGAIASDKLAPIYAEADLVVLPTVSDAFPLVALEAMACGTPVLASRISGLPEMIEDWETGFLVKPGDVGQLAMGIRFLTGDGALRARMGENGRRKVRDAFRWQVVAERYELAYAAAVGIPPDPEPPAFVMPVEATADADPTPELVRAELVADDDAWAATA
jgi:glycosyltransferase involved in cell wall biosynthesis